MKPAEFVIKWSASELKERSACQEHFLDLCRMVRHPSPAEDDPKGERFCFERFAEKNNGADGYADVWKRGFFAIEYKGKHKDLNSAYQQLLRYREDLENPPLLVVCDMDRIIIHTNFTNTTKRTIELTLETMERPTSLETMRALFFNPDKLKPGATVEFVSQEAARQVGALARRIEDRGVPAMEAARFVMKLVFALFAEDVELLPGHLFAKILDQCAKKPAIARPMLEKLFLAMRDGDDGMAFTLEIPHFNGGLFEDTHAFDLEASDIKALQEVAELDWSTVDPVIFGNLYEYGLGLEARSKRGVHYTSREDIRLLVEPTILRLWRDQWQVLRSEVTTKLAAKAKAKPKSKGKDKALESLKRRIEDFRESLGRVEVLDPACGSGNFLLVTLQMLLDLELEVIRFQAENFHVQALSFCVGPQQLHGIEFLAFPHALASVVVWIGHLQWLYQHGYSVRERPILKRLELIQHGDSLKIEWPKVDAIVGNPPFIGDKKLRGKLSDEYVSELFRTWSGKVPGGADYVCYWFEKAREAMSQGRAKRVGLIATNSIRQGANRVVLEKITAGTSIFFAESDRKWILEGASVRVSMVGFGKMGDGELPLLDGVEVPSINAGLSNMIDLSQAERLHENSGASFIGDQKSGPFEIPGELAHQWLSLPPNPNGNANADVLRKWINGDDIMSRDQGRWIIDFGLGPNRPKDGGVDGELYIGEAAASFYEAPFAYAFQHVKPARAGSGSEKRTPNWFLHVWPRPEMRRRTRELGRYLATVIHSKHRVFRWYDSSVLASHALAVIGTNQDADFGLLQSRVHEMWALALCSALEDRPRYTPNTTFETFPFPAGFRDHAPEAVTQAAKALDEARERWLNPPGASAAVLKKRTLTNLYNEREAGKASWLNHLHRDLDRAVLEAYGWSDLAGPLFTAEDALRATNPKGDALGLQLGKTPEGQAVLGRLLNENLRRVSAKVE